MPTEDKGCSARRCNHVFQREIQKHDRYFGGNGRAAVNDGQHTRSSVPSHADGKRRRPTLGGTRRPLRKVRDRFTKTRTFGTSKWQFCCCLVSFLTRTHHVRLRIHGTSQWDPSKRVSYSKIKLVFPLLLFLHLSLFHCVPITEHVECKSLTGNWLACYSERQGPVRFELFTSSS